MERITKTKLDQQVKFINSRLEGMGFTLDHFSSGWRLEKGGEYVSPRLKTSEMYWWLDGFISSIVTIQREWRF